MRRLEFPHINYFPCKEVILIINSIKYVDCRLLTEDQN